MYTQNRNNIERHVKTHSQRSDEDRSAVTILETFLRANGKISTNFSKEDKHIIKTLGKMLGKTDIDGQVSEIEQANEFLHIQIEKAEKERQKNEKLYKSLGMVIGIAIIIILV